MSLGKKQKAVRLYDKKGKIEINVVHDCVQFNMPPYISCNIMSRHKSMYSDCNAVQPATSSHQTYANITATKNNKRKNGLKKCIQIDLWVIFLLSFSHYDLCKHFFSFIYKQFFISTVRLHHWFIKGKRYHRRTIPFFFDTWTNFEYRFLKYLSKK